MLADVRAEIREVERDLTELRATEAWLLGGLETRKRVTVEQVRDWFAENPSHVVSAATLGSLLGCSAAQVRMRLEPLLAAGTVIKVISDLPGTPVRYRFDVPEVGELRAKPERVVRVYSGGEVAGTARHAGLGRRVAQNKARRGHR